MSQRPKQPGPTQRGLFGDLADEPRPRVEAAGADPALAALAQRLPTGLRLGTSSWSFPGWRGIVYAPGAAQKHLSRHGLSAYASHPLLRAVGVDRTFYAPIDAADFAAYADAVPADFRFLVKAWAEVTSPHPPADRGGGKRVNPHFLDPSFAAETCVAPALEGLDDKLGPLVFQFPPLGKEHTQRPAAFAELLHAFLTTLPRGPRYAVELRDEDLVTPDYAAAIADAGASHCFSVHPRMPSIERQRELVTPGTNLVARWMLQPPLGYQQAKERFEPFAALALPDPDRRQQLADLCANALVKGGDVTVVINNKAEGSAPLSAFALAEVVAAMLADESRA